MEAIAQYLTRYCINNHIAEPGEAEWLLYCIEKKLMSIAGTLAMALLAALLSNPATALCFFTSFRLLRGSTGGYHARTPGGCFCLSIVTVAAFFLGLYPRLGLASLLACNLGAAVSIFLLAPYNHPNMHLNNAEVLALRVRSRVMASLVTLASLCLWPIGLLACSRGLCMGLSMTALSLLLAYFKDRRVQNEQAESIRK